MVYASITIWLTVLLGCGQNNIQDRDIFSEDYTIAVQKEPDILVGGTRLKIQKKKTCTQIKGKYFNDEMDFLNSNIRYFKVDTIILKLLGDKKYYQEILQKTHFLEFEENNFTKKKSVFSLKKHDVKNYGPCYLGQYYFPTSANSGQSRVTVIINMRRKEISIWNFDNVSVSRMGLKCDFNVRGSHSIYRMVYLNNCKSFALTIDYEKQKLHSPTHQ